MIMSPGLRKLTLAVHLTVSVGWIGAVAGYLALDITTVTSDRAHALRAAFIGMDLIARNAIVPLALASLITGIVISLGTKWGLFRHYWVLISLLLTVIATVVLLVETQTVSQLAEIAAAPTTSISDLRALPSTLVHSVGGTLVLLVILVLNIYKPRGVTRYGWRKQQQQRKQHEQRTTAVHPTTSDLRERARGL
jgi:hypothetical protein